VPSDAGREQRREGEAAHDAVAPFALADVDQANDRSAQMVPGLMRSLVGGLRPIAG
jgi:hypothetical protein